MKPIKAKPDIHEEFVGPEQIMNGISLEILNSLKLMKDTKAPDDKLIYSQSIKYLCESLGVFLDNLSDVFPYDDDIPF